MEFVNLTKRSKLYLFFYFLFKKRSSIVRYENMETAKAAAKYLQEEKFKAVITKENDQIFVNTIKRKEKKWKKH